jgi:hypothetical protein
MTTKKTNQYGSIPGPLIDRALIPPSLLEKKTLFLFGPRQTGKTFLIRHALPKAKVYDLLDHSVFLAMSQNPSRLGQEISPGDRLVVIDEIQRLPVLLNEVHRLIEEHSDRFQCPQASKRWHKSLRGTSPDPILASAYLPGAWEAVRSFTSLADGITPLRLFLS